MMIQLDEARVFAILREIELGTPSFQLIEQGHPEWLIDLLFRLRHYILKCADKRMKGGQDDNNKGKTKTN